jgi:hypothetical protein
VKLPASFPVPAVPSEVSPEWVRFLLETLGRHLQQIAQCVNGQLSFGSGVDAENVRGKWITYVSNAVADTEDTVAHNLVVVPIGYLVFSVDKAGVVYKGTTTWTTSNLYLKCNAATTTALLFVLTGPSST